ncbi:hypothetical protein AZE41_17010 [Sporosarcina psychrophila]|nr:hypothetical protein AZE41_17010 [Sporosarcina psychrophila]
MPAESVRSERKSTGLKEIGLFQWPPLCTNAFGARRMNKHHTITEKMCRDATKSHPYTSRHLGNRIEVVQSKVIQIYCTRSA